jgi:hypothetical protein
VQLLTGDLALAAFVAIAMTRPPHHELNLLWKFPSTSRLLRLAIPV